MKTIQFSDEQLTYLRQVVMDSITDDAHFLRRINRGQSPQWYKDNTARVETGSDIMAKLKGQEVLPIPDFLRNQENLEAEKLATAAAAARVISGVVGNAMRDSDYIDDCLEVLGISRTQYDKAMAKRCVHGSLATQECAECDNLKPVGPTCPHGVILGAECVVCCEGTDN